MTLTPNPLPPPTRRKLLFGIGSVASASAISPTLAVTSPGGAPIGSEKRVSQVELDRIVGRHQLWLDRKTGGALANLSGHDLSGLKFGRWNLRHVNFVGANLSKIHATETCFYFCDFSAADLSGAYAINCDFRYTRFRRAKLVGVQIHDTDDGMPEPVGDGEPWYWGGALRDANLEEADLRGMVIRTNTDETWTFKT